MATFTITTLTNIDALVGRVGGDIFNVNGGTLIIDEDTRYGLNANTSAIMAGLTPSPTLGGSILIDGRAIWLIPFTGGAGTVPAFNTAITRGGATGKCIGVYAALNAAPLAPGAAMPATGWIKVKQWNFVLYGTGALGGITATAAAGENVGWIEPVGQEAATSLLSSLNQTYGDGSFCKGDWYTVGTTTGNRATSYQIPSNGQAIWHGGVWVDKAPATAITAASWAAGVATFTSPAHGLSTDDRVMVDAILPRTWRTVDTQRCTVLNANQFTIPMPVNPGAYTSGGTVAVPEWWPTTDSLNTKVGPTDYQGKHCWLDSATGLLRFGNDNTTSTGGALPASGLVIRLPNVMTQNSPSATKTINSLPASVASRYRPYNGNAGVLKIDHMSGGWSLSIIQTGKYFQIADSAIVNLISISSQAAACTVTNVCVGGNGSTTAVQALVASSLNNPVTVTDSCFSTGEMAARYPFSIASSYGVIVDRCRFTGTGDRTAVTYSVNGNIGKGATFTRCQFGPHSLFISSQLSGVKMTNSSYYSAAYGLNQITFAGPTINLTNLATDCEFSDFTLLGTTPLARNGLLTVASGSDNPIIRNWGTYASPIDMRINGTKYWASWTRVTTVCTVTETAHPYRVGDQVMVFNSSNSSGITLATKTITAVTANTFDFTCLNVGTTSGQLSYYVANLAGSILSMATVANAKIQNVHIRGNLTQPSLTASSQHGLVLDNFTTEPDAYNLIPTMGANNMQGRSVGGGDYPLITQQSSIFGTHFADMFVRSPGTAVPGQAAAVTGATWSRTTTLCTVTSPNHGMTGAGQRVWVESSSAPTAIANGWGVMSITTTIIDKDTFSFSCLNTGATSGTLDYWWMGDAIFRVIMSEPSTVTAAQAAITANAGLAGFTGAGSLVLPAIGDQATWETPTFILGYDGFGHTPCVAYGNGLTTLPTLLAFNYEYALDRGAGFGPWRNASYPRAGAGGTAGTPQVTMTNTAGVQVGDYVNGTGIGTGAKVLSIDSGTQVTLSVNNTAAVSGTLIFWYMPNETTFPATGIKLKVRVTANAANVSAFYNIDLPLLSSNTSRARLYSQLTQYTLTFTGLVAGSDIRVLDAGTVTSKLDADAVPTTTYGFPYDYVPGTPVDIQITKDGFKPYRYENFVLPAKNADFLVQQAVAIDEGS